MGVTGKVLPTVKVLVVLEISLPCILDGRLEGHHKHAFGTELLGKLVGGERLAEAHLRVPKESRNGVHILLPDGVKVRVCFVDSLGLLLAHRKSLVMCTCDALARTQFSEDS